MSMYDNNLKDDLDYEINKFLDEGGTLAELLFIVANAVRYRED